jgi:hypothetical protein
MAEKALNSKGGIVRRRIYFKKKAINNKFPMEKTHQLPQYRLFEFSSQKFERSLSAILKLCCPLLVRRFDSFTDG